MTQDAIVLKGVKVNNLKNLNLEIPKNQLVVVTGVSGSGKSSLVFDTIAAESKRQMNKNYPMYLRRRMELIERPDAQEMTNLTPSLVINQKNLTGGSRSNVQTALDLAPLIRLLFSRIGQPSVGEASAYRKNDPQGRCDQCQGRGEIRQVDKEALVNPESTLAENGINFKPIGGSWQKSIFVESGLFDPDKKLKDYSKKEWHNLLYGPDQDYKVFFNSDKTGQSFTETYEGLIPRFERLYLNRDISRLSKKVQEETEAKIISQPCPKCQASGYSQEVLHSTINGCNIVDYSQMEMDQLSQELQKVEGQMGEGLAQQILTVVKTMEEAGIGYLTLDRPISSLSGGERQRLKLVANLTSSLNNMTYILDEPSAGLHPYDSRKIKDLLLEIKANHNSLIVVEHNRDIMAMADWIIDMGPKAGSKGGQVIFQGRYQDLLESDTKTGQYLRRPQQFAEPGVQNFEEFIHVEGASHNNLKNIDVKFPLGAFSMVTGLAGSGKTSLIQGEVLKAYPQAIYLSQAGIGISSRSTPATYLNIMDKIRNLFAQENEVDPGLFSFNSKGACPVCGGKGYLEPDVAFADPISFVCDHCQGTRYSNEARTYTYQGQSIVDVLNLTVNDALDFFAGQEKITQPLSLLEDVGLDYLTLGQATSSLSGGELQRLKLGSELQKEGKIYILDEPSSGLHLADVDQLLNLIHYLIQQGNTVIAIDHHASLMLDADWLVDLGPGPGRQGGDLLYQGPAKGILNVQESYTGQYLKEITQGDNKQSFDGWLKIWRKTSHQIENNLIKRNLNFFCPWFTPKSPRGGRICLSKEKNGRWIFSFFILVYIIYIIQS